MGRERFFRLLEKESQLFWRGELWVAGDVLRELGLTQRQYSLIDLAVRAGWDICFFSYSSPIQQVEKTSGEMEDMIKLGHACGLACGVTVDGPFERLVGKLGFMEVMSLFQDEAALRDALQQETLLAAEELAAAERAGADLLVLCDDIAYNRGLYFSPVDYKNLILPLYRQLKGTVGGDTPLGFHSDGNIESIIAGLYKEGYTFFSVEPEAMDLIGLSASLPREIVFISGIKADWLMDPDIEEKETDSIKEYIYSLVSGRKVILSSACGIARLSNLDRLKRIYRLIGCGRVNFEKRNERHA